MRIFTFALSIFCTINLFAQSSEREKELMELEQNQDSIPRTVFLNIPDFDSLDISFTSNTRQIWILNDRDVKDLSQFYDIRLKFKNHDKAIKFHRKYWKENSEFGPEIKKHKIKSNEVSELRVFRAIDMINGISRIHGLQMYCYIFVVDDYFVKFYVSCKIGLKPDFIQPYLDEAVRRIKEN